MPLPIVGNDIVDLGWAERGPNRPSEAFARRICARSEWALLERSPRPRAHLWYLWSAKETAFKALQRVEPRQVFRHAHFVVDPEASVVRVGEQRVRVAWSERSGCLSCWGYLDLGEPPVIVTAAAPLGAIRAEREEHLSPRERRCATTAESVAARVLAKRLLARRLGVVFGNLEIVRERRPASFSGWAPPELLCRGEPLPHACVSLSHHGRFVGCALAVAASVCAQAGDLTPPTRREESEV